MRPVLVADPEVSTKIGKKTRDGKPLIEIELFHPVSSLSPVTLAFEVLSGVTLGQARELVEKMNDYLVGVIVTPK